MADDSSATIVGVEVCADEELGRSRKHCKTECRSRALNTSVSQDIATIFTLTASSSRNVLSGIL